MKKQLNFQSPNKYTPPAELVFKDEGRDDLFGKTMGVKWWVDGELYGIWFRGWNAEQLAFYWWLALISTRIPILKLLTGHLFPFGRRQ